MFDKDSIIDVINTFCRESEYNYISAEDALAPELAGVRMYTEPLIAFADAVDPLFQEFKSPEIIGEKHLLPTEWLPEAKSVISVFLPYEKSVVAANAADPEPPTPVWLHARIEGQIMLDRLTDRIEECLREQGYKTVCPETSGKFEKIHPFAGNWSERHTAYVAGLGTFGLHRGLITEKGTAGRFASVITDMALEPTKRPYSSPFEYCTMCGVCAKKCPAGAIDPKRGLKEGKDHTVCSPYLKATWQAPHGPHQRVRYGCAKCMSGVPCSYRNPSKKAK